MSQTITLQKSIWVAGVLQASGATISVDDALAGALVHAGSAVYVNDPLAADRIGAPPATFTWTAKPAATDVQAGTEIYVSDVGIGGSYWYSDGERWRARGRVNVNSAGVLATEEEPLAKYDDDLAFFAPFKTTLKPMVGPAVTFTRASVATVRDCHDNIVPVLSGEARFFGARRVQNLLTAGNSNVLGAGWTLDANATATAQALEIGPLASEELSVTLLARASGSGTAAYFRSNLARLGRYVVSLWVKAASSNNAAYKLRLQRTAATTDGAEVTFTATSTWTRYAVVHDVRTTGNHDMLITPVNAGAGNVLVSCLQYEWVDDDQTAPSEYVANGGREAPYYHGAMVDGVRYFSIYNPWTRDSATGVCTDTGVESEIPDSILRGLSCSESVMWNRITYSADPSNAAWTKGAVGTPTKYNGVKVPTGYDTLWHLPEDATTAEHKISQGWSSTSLTDGNEATVSVFARAAERSWLRLTLVKQDGSSKAHAWFNLSTGAIGTVSGGTNARAEIEAVGTLYRCQLTDESGTGASAPVIEVGIATQDNETSYAGTAGSGLYITGMQLEEGNMASSYVPTAGSIVQRVAEVLTLPASLIPAAEFSVCMDFTPAFSTANRTRPEYFYVCEWYKSATERGGLALRHTTDAWAQDFYTAAISPWDGKNVIGHSLEIGEANRLGLSISATAVPGGSSGSRFAVDGLIGTVSASATESVAPLGTLPDYLVLGAKTSAGSRSAASTIMSAWYKNVAVYGRALPNPELAAWTPPV